jgi:hypothetical protein
MALEIGSLTDYAFGGFVFVRRSPKPDIARQTPLPSLCDCIAQHLPATWLLGWSEQARQSLATRSSECGFAPDRSRRLSEFVASLQSQGELASGSILRTVRAARSLLVEFDELSGWLVVGLAIHEQALQKLGTVYGGQHCVVPSLADVLRDRSPIPNGGVPLGFELLVADEFVINGHSWLCNGLDVTLESDSPSAVNAHRLIDNEGVAMSWADRIESEGLGEPGTWVPWLLLDFTISLSARPPATIPARLRRTIQVPFCGPLSRWTARNRLKARRRQRGAQAPSWRGHRKRRGACRVQRSAT